MSGGLNTVLSSTAAVYRIEKLHRELGMGYSLSGSMEQHDFHLGDKAHRVQRKQLGDPEELPMFP